mmetsp:Transcript_19977/g.45250  ORF Transcript_19977/g.45250 Transcript_19977/m.45250 type:complete len:123 (-) Transcript_19977:336-704(-)
MASAGQVAAKEASKAAQREKELAAFAKKQERKDKEWEKGSKDTSKAEEETKAKEEVKAKKVASKEAEAAEGGKVASGGAPLMKTCKECKKKYNANSKKGCQNCIDNLLGFGAASSKPKAKKK